MLEKDIQKYLIGQVKKYGGFTYKFASPSNRGVSDLICFIGSPIQIWFIEVKTEEGKLSRLQELFRDKFLHIGLNYKTIYGKKGTDEWLKSLNLISIKKK